MNFYELKKLSKSKQQILEKKYARWRKKKVAERAAKGGASGFTLEGLREEFLAEQKL